MYFISQYAAAIGGAMFMALPLAVFVRAFASMRMRKLNISTTRVHEIGAALLIMYCAGIVAVTVVGNPSALSPGRELLKVNLIPFKFVYDLIYGCYAGKPAAALINILGNIAVFVPFGFLLSLLWRGAGWRKAALSSAAASLVIELCQLTQTGRSTDIDDILLNTTGGLTGYMIYRLIKAETVSRFRVTYNKTYSELQE
jgi:glycopeptide antibiotics resistance protein